MLETLNAINKKVDDANLTLGDFASNKNKISCENSDLLRIVGDLDNNLNILAKQKAALAAQLNDVKALCDNEARERGLLLGKYRNLEHELDGARCALEEEAAGRENTLRLVAKAESESQCWRQKYETDAVAKGEELEMTKMKLTARLTEAEAAIDNLNAKLNQVEKAKGKIASEISEMTSSLDQAQVLNNQMEKKAKHFDKVIGEWKGKVDRLSYDLDVGQKETRNASSELFKVKSAYEETMLQLEEVRRENKTLSNEIKDIMDQISEGGRSIHEIDKIRKRLEAEKLEVEALRMKKKLDSDVIDLGVALEHANAANAESQRNISLIQGNIRNVQKRFEEESRAKAVATDNLISADRRANANQNALEEARTLLEQADRNRRMVEQELADTNESLSDQTCTNQAICGAKMKCEQEMGSMSHDLDEMTAEAHLSEEKAQRAMIDAARLADELRMEQETAMALERDKKLLEAQVKDAQNRCDEAEQNALKGGKKAMAKMETRVRELESEMDAENRRCTDAQKNLRRSERHIKELTYQQDEDRKNHERMQGLIDQLQGKIKSYKKQIEEAEEIAALNLAKFRQVQTNLAGSTERADLNEQALAKTRARGRSASIGPM